MSTKGVHDQQMTGGFEVNGQKYEWRDGGLKPVDIKATITDKGDLSLKWMTKEILSCDSFKHFDAVYSALYDSSALLRDNGLKVPKWMEILEKQVSTYMNHLHDWGPVQEAIANLLEHNEQSRKKGKGTGKAG